MNILNKSQQVIINPNLLINADFSEWQRGTSFAGTNYAYTADRVQVESSTSDWQCNRIGADWNNGIIGKEFMQRVRGTGSYENTIFSVENGVNHLKGKTLTFTVSGGFEDGVTYPIQVRKSSKGFSGSVITEGSFVGKGELIQEASFTFTLPNIYDATNKHLIVQIQHQNETKGHSTHLYHVKLEKGSFSTELVPDDPAINLSKCQRYYFKSNHRRYAVALQLNSVPWSKGEISIDLPTIMRKEPVVIWTPANTTTLTEGNAFHDQVRIEANSSVPNSVAHITNVTADAEL